MRTDVVFGMAADGRTFPEHPGGPRGALDHVVVGPAGLLGMLALRLGLAGPATPSVVRVATWLSKLDAASKRERFWSESFRTDPWSTAAATLALRDALVEGGWTAEANTVGGRLTDLADTELIGRLLPPSRSDLLRAVVGAIRAGAPTEIGRVDLLEPLETLPPGWGDLMSALEAVGVTVSLLPARRPGGDDDLARLQRFLQHGSERPLAGDGSVTILQGQTSLMAAEALAESLASDPSAGAGTVVLVPDRDGALLDASLRARGAPAFGMSTPSPDRGPLQLLPATFAAAWLPFDAGALLRLLQLPSSPLPDWVGRRLSAALAREPGVGSVWAEAWEGIAAEAARLSGGEPARSLSARLDGWRAWASTGRFDREAGIPTPEAVAVCRRIRDWAVAVDGGKRAPLFVGCVEAAASLEAAIVASGRELLPATLVESMVEAALEGGHADPSSAPEASLARAVSDPGALWGEAATVAWWGFSGPTRGVPAPTWTAAEMASLAASGCRLDDPLMLAEREAAQWRRAISNVTGRLILVTSLADRGTEPTAHPLAGLASPLLADAPLMADAEALLMVGGTTMIGSEIVRRAVPVRAPPTVQARWAVPGGLAARSLGRVESATTLQDLLDCPLRWLLADVAGLRRRGDRALPSTGRMLGNLAHAVAAKAFLPGEIPEPSAVLLAARRALPELVDRIAAPLRLPTHAADLAFAAERIPESLAELARGLAREGIAVVGMEADRERPGDPPVRGRIDMLLLLPSGAEAVVDLKWAGSAARRRREIADGRAVQLATYGRLIDGRQGLGGPHAGYYLLLQRKLVAGCGSPLATEETPVTRSLDDTWRAVEADHALHVRLLSEGSVMAFGSPGADDLLPDELGFPPDRNACAFCEFRTICREPMEDRR